MSASVGRREAIAGTTAVPRQAPWCGARTRAGGSCLGLAMVSGRCRVHGGASTGPRTAVGLARMVAAKTAHGRYAMSGSPKRLAQRWVRTLNVRIRLTAAATLLRPISRPGWQRGWTRRRRRCGRRSIPRKWRLRRCAPQPNSTICRRHLGWGGGRVRRKLGLGPAVR